MGEEGEGERARERGSPVPSLAVAEGEPSSSGTREGGGDGGAGAGDNMDTGPPSSSSVARSEFRSNPVLDSKGVPRSPGRGGPKVEEVDGNWYPVTRRRYLKKKWAGPQALRRRMMTQQKRELKKNLRPGEVIHKLHRSYDLMLNLQLGIRWSVGKAEGEAAAAAAAGGSKSEAPTQEEYDRREKQVFPSAGSAETPPHPSRDFKWKDYSPAVFRKLRVAYGEDSGEYMVSVTGSQALRQMGSPGKSGSVFFMSHDDRYIIKTMRKDEQKKLQAMLPDYYEHVHRYPNSLLTRFYGVHKVKPEREGRNVRFVVMRNAFCTDLEIHETYDLKGSTQGRVSTRKERASLRYVRKDLDYQGVKYVRAAWRGAMLEQLEADVAFLARHNIMDYSLLLGVHYENPPPFRPAQLPPPQVSGFGACCAGPSRTRSSRDVAGKYAASHSQSPREGGAQGAQGARGAGEVQQEDAGGENMGSGPSAGRAEAAEVASDADEEPLQLAHRRAMSWDFAGALPGQQATPTGKGEQRQGAGDGASFVLKEWDTKERMSSPRVVSPHNLKIKIARREAPLPAIPDMAADDDDEVTHRRSQSAGFEEGQIDYGWREHEVYSGGREWESEATADAVPPTPAPIFGHDMPAALVNRAAPGTWLHRDADPVLLKGEGHDEWGRPDQEQVYLFFSVIDILQGYNYTKSFENVVWQTMNFGRPVHSAVPPELYAKRFIEYVRTNFLGVEEEGPGEQVSAPEGVSAEAFTAAHRAQHKSNAQGAVARDLNAEAAIGDLKSHRHG